MPDATPEPYQDIKELEIPGTPSSDLIARGAKFSAHRCTLGFRLLGPQLEIQWFRVLGLGSKL